MIMILMFYLVRRVNNVCNYVELFMTILYVVLCLAVPSPTHRGCRSRY